MDNSDFMRLAIEQAKQGAALDEVPVGAVVVKDGQVIALAHNEKEGQNCAVAHAEILALQRACKAVDNWYLEGCTLYCTLEPCAMCVGAMLNSRIDSLYFGAYDAKAGCAGSVCDLLREGLFNHTVAVQGGLLAEECGAMLTEFFRGKRKKA